MSVESDPVQVPPEAESHAELFRGFVALVMSRGSRKAAWDLLKGAGLVELSLKSFYAQARKDGLDAVVSSLFVLDKLEAIRELVANPPPLPPRRVAVSTLANQYYCEMQVHLGTLHDVRVTSAELAAGNEGHARLEAEAEPISEEEVTRRIEVGEKMGLVELGLAGEVEGVPLIGRADRVQLEGAKARLLLEWKFSGRRDLYPTHVVQVEAYGKLLRASGFETSELVHAVAVIPRGGPRPENMAELMAKRAADLAAAAPWAERRVPTNSAMPDPLAGLGVRRLDASAFTLFVFPHHELAAERDVSWALGYWKGARTPSRTTSPSRCRACPYNAAGLCEVALSAPDGRYKSREMTTREGHKVHLLVATPSMGARR
ncbi:MAG: PD-(D/E)XK nuclease family protein [Polyangiales bacterium]